MRSLCSAVTALLPSAAPRPPAPLAPLRLDATAQYDLLPAQCDTEAGSVSLNRYNVLFLPPEKTLPRCRTVDVQTCTQDAEAQSWARDANDAEVQCADPADSHAPADGTASSTDYPTDCTESLLTLSEVYMNDFSNCVAALRPFIPRLKGIIEDELSGLGLSEIDAAAVDAVRDLASQLPAEDIDPVLSNDHLTVVADLRRQVFGTGLLEATCTECS